MFGWPYVAVIEDFHVFGTRQAKQRKKRFIFAVCSPSLLASRRFRERPFEADFLILHHWLYKVERFDLPLLRFEMDSVEPEQTPFAAVTAQTSKIQRVGPGT
jgi:hypothetical protein